MMTKVLEAIIALLKFNPHGCTLAQVAKIAEQKQKDVLAEINRNREFLSINEKGKIVKISTANYIEKTLIQEYKNHKLYITNPINYGAASEIKFQDAAVNYPQLYETYYCGGLGDSYAIKIILLNEKNLNFVKSLGKQDRADRYAELAAKPIEYFWKG